MNSRFLRSAMTFTLFLVSCGPKIERGTVPVERAASPVQLLTIPEPTSPNVYLEAVVAAGSAYDPIGKEGLAALTAHSLVEAGAGQRSSQQLKQALYPTGNDIEVLVDREFVSFRLKCHRDHAQLCLELFVDVLSAPRFDDADVSRIRDEALYAVSEGLLSNEEALAYEVMNAWLYEGHPYGHPVDGRAGVVPTLTSADAEAFHARHYVRGAIVVGLAGGFEASLEQTLSTRLEALDTTTKPDLVLQDPPAVIGRSLLAVDTETPVTGFYLGHPLSLRRDHADWPALYVAYVALGEHRQSHGRLFRELRTARGLNYGDYAYIEPFVQRGWSSMPEQGALRRQTMTYLWLRPTGLENGAFALKLALAEWERFAEQGLSPDEFEVTRHYVAGRLALLAREPGRRLSYALEAAAAGQPNILETLPDSLEGLTVEQVNDAIHRHIHPSNVRIVAVSGEAEALMRQIVEGSPTPIVYAEGIAPTDEQTARDAEVAGRVLGVAPDVARSVPAEGIFR